MPATCARCRTERIPTFSGIPASDTVALAAVGIPVADDGTALTDDREARRLHDGDDWLSMPEGPVCGACAGEFEQWAAAGCCVRCGADPYEDDDEPVGWVDPTNPCSGAMIVCSDCATAPETRDEQLGFLRSAATAYERVTAAGRAITAEHFDTAIRIMYGRSIPNHVDGDDPPDAVSEELAESVRECAALVYSRSVCMATASQVHAAAIETIGAYLQEVGP